MLDIVIAIALMGDSVLMAYLGVHVTLHPADSDKTRFRYKVGFGLCALLACALIGWQTYRNDVAQSELKQELSRIESNTKTPPRVNVNVPPLTLPSESVSHK